MDRKEYNKIYYANKKKEICEKLFTKVECDLCGRSVTHQNLPKHKKSNYCKLRHERNKPKADKYDDLMAQVNNIQDTMNKMNKMAEEDPLMYCWGCQESFKESEKKKHKCKK
jgi:hypothetical protein